jgi:hypothetical protein
MEVRSGSHVKGRKHFGSHVEVIWKAGSTLEVTVEVIWKVGSPLEVMWKSYGRQEALWK